MKNFSFFKCFALTIIMILGFSNTLCGQYSGTGTFTKITSLADLTDGEYVIAYGATFAMINTTSGSGNSIHILSTAITPAADIITNPDPSIVWKIETDGSSKTIYNEAIAQYVSSNGANNSALFIANVTNAARWTFTYVSNLFRVENVNVAGRFLQYNTASPRFACYTGTQQHLTLYKMDQEVTGEEHHETFNTLTNLAGSTAYNAGTQVGSTGYEWQWDACQDGNKQNPPWTIESVTPVLRNPSSFVQATIPGGISKFSLDYKRAYTSTATRIVQVYINGNLVATGENCGGDTELRTLEAENLNISGSFTVRIELQGTGTTNAQTCIDNFIWESYGTANPIVATPVIAPNGGSFTETKTVEITCSTEGAAIYYTLDGTEPTSSSILYTAPVPLDETGTYNLKAVGVKANHDNSPIASALFVIKLFEAGECDLLEDFEDAAWAGGSYTARDVTDLQGNDWRVAAVGNMDDNDRRFDNRSLRLRGNNANDQNDNTNRIEMSFDRPNGIGTVSFNYASYSSHSGGVLALEYSTDQGTNWINAGNTPAAPSWVAGGSKMLEASFEVDVPGNARIRIIKYYGGSTNSMNIDNLCITDFASSTVATPTFTPPGGNQFAPVAVTINCATQGATIYYTTNGTDPTVGSSVYNNPINVSTTTTIKAMAVKADMDNSGIATATYTFPTNVDNIAAFKAAGAQEPTLTYKITGNVTFVFRNGRNIYIKDATGGLIIYDNPTATQVITNTYNNGDIISGGVIGTYSVFNGQRQLLPLVNTAAGTPGTPVQPITLTMANLLANFTDYESQLVKLEEVAFAGGTFGTGAAANIGISQGAGNMICRNQFGTFTGYVTNPATRYDVAGFVIPYNADRQIAPRDSINDIKKTEYTVTLSSSPNGAGTLTGAGTYNYNAQVTINATPGAAYNFVNWTEGTATITENPYSFNITESRTFTANFQIKTYTITASVNGGNGMIAPPGVTTVNHGGSQAYTITPNTGYEIDQVLINGVNNPAAVSSGTYTFQNVTANQTIVASFKLGQYTLTFNPSTGTVSPTSKPVTYSFPIGTLPVPTQLNCIFLRWEIDGTPISANTPWTWDSNKTAIAIFHYPISVSNMNPLLGTVAPATTINYLLGQNATYTFTPNPGAHIATVVVDGIPVFTGNPETTAPWSYTFDNIQAYHNLSVSFATNCYAMNPGNIIGTGATVTMNPAGCIPHGSNVTFNISADCYQYEVWIGDEFHGLYNATANNEGYTHTITNITGKLPLIKVFTTIKQYTVMATPSQMESPWNYISPAGLSYVDCGVDKMYDFIMDLGYRVRALFIDGEEISVPNTIRRYNLENIRFNRTIHVEFEDFPQYIIQFGPRAAQNAGGFVYPTIPFDESGEIVEFFIAIDSGTLVYPFTIIADDGFEIDKVYVDDVIVNVTGTSIATYEFFDLDANHTLFVTFKPITYSIMATAEPGGSINPSGAVQVVWGTNQTFHIFPNTGYEINDVIVNGNSEGAINSYTFEDVKANGTIHATFSKIIYEITTSVSGGNGFIVPIANPILVEHGDNVILTFVPNEGYRVNTVLIDNVPNHAAALAGSYTFTNVIQSHEVEVTFAKLTFTITATATTGGTIDPQGITTVEYGVHSPIYVFNPDPGFYIISVLVDGIVNHEAIQNGLYRFFNVKANHTLHVIFASDTYTIAATASQGGSISPSGVVNVPANTDRRFDFVAEQGFELIRVMVDGFNQAGAVTNGFYVFENVMENHTIAAIFERLTYSITLLDVAGATYTDTAGVPISGVPTVAHGGRFMFKVTLDEGYNQSNITVRDTISGMIMNSIGGIYTLNNIVRDYDITVENAVLNQYRITARAFAGGTMNPDGVFMVTHGADQTFTFTPNQNFEIDKVLVNNKVVVLEDDAYTLKNIKADATVEAFFKRIVGIDENELRFNVFSYTNVVTIKNENLVPVKTVEIMDMFGRVVWKGQSNAETTEITLHVAAGIYAVRIIMEDNQQVITKVSIN